MEAVSLKGEVVFEARRLSFAYAGAAPLLRDLDLVVRGGELVALIGPNGAGKSTLLHLLTGWLAPTAGVAMYRGRAARAWDRRAFAREVAVVPQREEGTFPFLVEEVVLMGRYAHQSGLLGFDDEEDHAIVRNCLQRVGLESMGHRTMEQLSGGECQRVLLARALAQCPSVLLLDEPTASLDLSHQREVFALLEELNAKHGLTVIVVSHDINLAALYCPRIVVLAGGRIAADGAPGELMKEELLREIYGAPVKVAVDDDGTPFVRVVR